MHMGSGGAGVSGISLRAKGPDPLYKAAGEGPCENLTPALGPAGGRPGPFASEHTCIPPLAPACSLAPPVCGAQAGHWGLSPDTMCRRLQGPRSFLGAREPRGAVRRKCGLGGVRAGVAAAASLAGGTEASRTPAPWLLSPRGSRQRKHRRGFGGHSAGLARRALSQQQPLGNPRRPYCQQHPWPTALPQMGRPAGTGWWNVGAPTPPSPPPGGPAESFGVPEGPFRRAGQPSVLQCPVYQGRRGLWISALNLGPSQADQGGGALGRCSVLRGFPPLLLPLVGALPAAGAFSEPGLQDPVAVSCPAEHTACHHCKPTEGRAGTDPRTTESTAMALGISSELYPGCTEGVSREVGRAQRGLWSSTHCRSQPEHQDPPGRSVGPASSSASTQQLGDTATPTCAPWGGPGPGVSAPSHPHLRALGWPRPWGQRPQPSPPARPGVAQALGSAPPAIPTCAPWGGPGPGVSAPSHPHLRALGWPRPWGQRPQPSPPARPGVAQALGSAPPAIPTCAPWGGPGPGVSAPSHPHLRALGWPRPGGQRPQPSPPARPGVAQARGSAPPAIPTCAPWSGPGPGVSAPSHPHLRALGWPRPWGQRPQPSPPARPGVAQALGSAPPAIPTCAPWGGPGPGVSAPSNPHLRALGWPRPWGQRPQPSPPARPGVAQARGSAPPAIPTCAPWGGPGPGVSAPSNPHLRALGWPRPWGQRPQPSPPARPGVAQARGSAPPAIPTCAPWGGPGPGVSAPSNPHLRALGWPRPGGQRPQPSPPARPGVAQALGSAPPAIPTCAPWGGPGPGVSAPSHPHLRYKQRDRLGYWPPP
ncbi:basic proline-rich protein-like [Loxodonta africana]|uniref:basic proline-rich protein-like n=1 Tax=Loxodonta africana TaxID=9785 RepID=UPI0030CF34D3